ncbi:DNA polymerase V subunit UmuC, partial [Shigella flexneri]|nr:DNA polymerase V subunit UmuC [Shigella flexneri]
LREQVKSWTGLTMGVGIAPTKTLAKSAQWATKQWPQFSGVVALTAENRNRILKLLGLQPVGEVWGVGRRLTEKLNALGINTALQLAQANTAFIRKNFSVILERTVRELNGESCISLEEAPPAKQQIVCSGSGGYRQPLAQPRHRGRTASDLEATGPSHPDMDLDARTDVRFRVLGVLR